MSPILAPPKAEPVKDSFCLWAEPIWYSKDDTEDTKRQIAEKHNVPYKTLCTPSTQK